MPAPTRPVPAASTTTAAPSQRLALLRALRAADADAIPAEGALAAAKREKEQAQTAWDTSCRTTCAILSRASQISDERWEELGKEAERRRQRLIAATIALGDAEQARRTAKFNAEEARRDLTEYESTCAQRERFEMQMSIEQLKHKEKGEQILQAIEDANLGLAPGDPGYRVPGLDEYMYISEHWNSDRE